MIIGTVKGDIVSTINHPFYTGKKLLIVEKENFAGKSGGCAAATAAPAQSGPKPAGCGGLYGRPVAWTVL